MACRRGYRARHSGTRGGERSRFPMSKDSADDPVGLVGLIQTRVVVRLNGALPQPDEACRMGTVRGTPRTSPAARAMSLTPCGWPNWPSASARAASTSRTDRPRTNPAITNVSNAFVLVTPVPNSRETNASWVPRNFGRATVTGPVVVLTVVGQTPLRDPGRASGTSARCWQRARPRKSSTSACTATWISRRAPSRATSSMISARSRPEPNNASSSMRIRSVGDTRTHTGVVLPFESWSSSYGTYARRHLHRLMDTTDGPDLVWI